MSSVPLPPYMRKAQPPPPVTLGQLYEVKIDKIEFLPKKGPQNPDGSDYGDQYRFEFKLNIAGTEHEGRSWIKYYPEPTPKTKLGKLCMAIGRVTNTVHQSLDQAIMALQTHGRIFVKVAKFQSSDDGTQYPRFEVFADMLPGEQPAGAGAQAPVQPQAQVTLPQAPVALPPAPIENIDENMKGWIIANQDLLGKSIPPEIYNAMQTEQIQWLVDKKLAFSKDDLPWLSDKAKEYI